MTTKNTQGVIDDVGMPKIWFGSTAPTGYLECDGSTIDRTVYSALFAVIGTTYGIGNGSTTYELPDMRGKFLRGWDHGAGIDPDAGSRTDRGDGTTGDVVGANQADAGQGHRHNLYTERLTNNTTGAAGTVDRFVASGTTNVGDDVRELVTDSVNGTPRTSSETRPNNVNVMFIIKY